MARDGGAALRYVGESRLGVGEFLGDARANTFAFGDPFSLAQRNQQTPLRPRTVRVGLGARF